MSDGVFNAYREWVKGLKHKTEKELMAEAVEVLNAIGWGNAMSGPNGMGAIESQTLEIRERLDNINNTLERIAEALESK